MNSNTENKKPRLVIYGAGQFGLYIVRFAVEKGWPIVAAYNRAGDKVGQDIGRLAGLEKDLGVIVQDCGTADFKNLEADIGVVAIADRLAGNMLAYERLFGAGLNVICHGAESYYPIGSDPDVAAELDALAKAHGKTFTGSGIWDYSRVWPGIVVAGPCTEINSLFHKSITDAQAIGKRLMLFTGVGMTVEEFEEKIGNVAGNLGGFYKTIPQHVLEAMGYHTTSVTETREPILFDEPIHCRLLERDIKPGICAGTRIVVEAETEEGVTATAHIELRLFNEGEREYMEWQVDGKPSSSIRTERDDAGYATAGCLFNRIPDVIAAEPGIQELYKFGPMRNTALQ